MKHLLVDHIMSRDVVTLSAQEDVDLADTIMSLGRIRHLPVVGDDERVVGLITHRDLIKAQANALRNGEERKRSVESLMRAPVETVPIKTRVLHAARLIFEKKLGCLPVVEDGRLVGIVTEADFVKLVIEGLEDREGAD